IRLVSSPGEGSVFTFYLPDRYVSPAPRREGPTPSAPRRAPRPSSAPSLPVRVDPHADPALLGPGDIADDRSDLQPGDHVLLIVEDDADFARILLDRARERGFKGVVTALGEQVPALA